MFELIDNAYAKGYNHIKEELETGVATPREDFGETFTSINGDPFFQIFAIADGHGDSNCPRSYYGSKVACNVAVSALKEFAKDIADSGLEAELIRQGAQGPSNQVRIGKEDLVRQLIASIFSEWNSVVNAEFKVYPLTEKEKSGCDRYLEQYSRGERIEHIYGTTLIAGLLTDKYLLLLQQGDGRCDVFDAYGEVSQPIPWDDKCFANVTTSLCETDAIQRCRFCVIDVVKNPIIACIADSDGVEDSFASMELLHNYHRELLVHAGEYGMKALHAYLCETLPELSENNSRDDITICGFVDVEKVSVLIPSFIRANERVSIESRLKDIDDRLKSMDSMGKMDALKAQFEKACEEVEHLEKSLQKMKTEYQSASKKLAHMYSEYGDSDLQKKTPKFKHPSLVEFGVELCDLIEMSTKKIDSALADKEKKEIEYRDYQKRRESLLKERETVRVELALLDTKHGMDIVKSAGEMSDTATTDNLEISPEEVSPEKNASNPDLTVITSSADEISASSEQMEELYPVQISSCALTEKTSEPAGITTEPTQFSGKAVEKASHQQFIFNEKGEL